MSTQSRTSKEFPEMRYRKLIVVGSGEKKNTHFLLGYMPADFDMEYFAKSKKHEPLAEWEERFIPPRDRELLEKNQIFYIVRHVSGDVIKVEQLYGVPLGDLSHLYGHAVPEGKPKTRARKRVKADEPKTRTRTRARNQEQPRTRTRKRRAV